MSETIHPVLVAAQRYRQQVLQREDAAVQRLIGAYGQAYRRMGAQIQALRDRLDGQPMPFAQAVRLSRLEALRNQIELEIGRFGQQADQQLIELAQQSIEVGINHSTGLIEATLVSNTVARQAVMASFSELNPAQVETMLGFLDPDSPLRQGITTYLGPAVAENVSNRLIDGIIRGFNPNKTAQIVRAELGVGLAWAINTIRTANLYTYREASRQNYIANSRVVSGWTWYATLDGRVCGNCLSQHGTHHSLGETLNGHHQCRCTMLPDLPLAKSLGIDLPEIQPGEAWFAGQTPELQADILGPGMLAAWQAGAVTFEQFRSNYEHPAYGTMQRMPSMAELGLQAYYQN